MALDPKAWLVPQDLGNRFVDTFSAFEYALKAVGFRRSPFGRLEADWDAYARAIQDRFASLDDPRLLEAVTFLRNAPPRRQVEVKQVPTWDNITRPPGISDIEWLFRLVRQVRNNLVHGGKRSPNAAVEPGRDERLVESALAILVASAPLNPEVMEAYQSVSF